MHYLDVLWAQHERDQTSTRMDRTVDEISEQVIADYVDKELIKNVTADDRCHLKKFARKFWHFYQGRKLLNYPVCEHRHSKDFVGGQAARS